MSAPSSRLVAVAQARSCGATTATWALAAAWPRPIVVAECDPAGGDAAVRFGLSANRGVLSLAAAGGPIDAERLRPHLQVADGLDVVVGPVGAEAASAALGTIAGPLAETLAVLAGADALADCGRLGSATPSTAQVLARAGLVVLVAATTAVGVAQLAHRLVALSPTLAERVAVVLVGDGRPGCRPADVERALGLEVAGVLAHDWRGAEALAAGEIATRRFRTSALARSARPLAAELAGRLGPPDAAAEPRVVPEEVGA